MHYQRLTYVNHLKALFRNARLRWLITPHKVTFVTEWRAYLWLTRDKPARSGDIIFVLVSTVGICVPLSRAYILRAIFSHLQYYIHIYMSIYIHIHTHAHTHIYIYIYSCWCLLKEKIQVNSIFASYKLTYLSVSIFWLKKIDRQPLSLYAFARISGLQIYEPVS